MSDILEINASPRSDLGKAAMRRLRRTDKVPGIIYGDGKQPVLFTMAHNELAHSLENEAFAASVLTVNLSGSSEQVVIKELQRHPFKPRLMHLDLLRVSSTTQLSMTVPLHFINEDTAPGVKLSGGLVSHIMTEVDINCLPANLPEFITMDVGELEEGHSLHLSDLQLPEGVEIPALALGEDHDLPVVSIHKAKAVEEEVSEEGEEAAAATGDEEAEE
jgi:large subunit ribosomal protein L25